MTVTAKSKILKVECIWSKVKQASPRLYTDIVYPNSVFGIGTASLSKSHESSSGAESKASVIIVFWRSDELNTSVGQAPDCEADLEVRDCHDVVVAGSPSGVS